MSLRRSGLRVAVFVAAILTALVVVQGVASGAVPTPPLVSISTDARDGERPADQSAPARTRIVGGNATDNSKYPWQAQLGIGGNQFCGGSLIHPLIVLTAMHCLVDSEGKPMFAASELEIWLGRTQLSSGGTDFGAWELYGSLEAYDPATNENDVAFISLFEASTGPRLQIAGPSERALWTPGRSAYVSGWGHTAEDGDASPILKEALVPVIDDGACAGPGVYGESFIATAMFCAGYLGGGTDSCQGDSGGPLQSPIDGGGFRLVGIVSWGVGCAQPNKPGVYTRIGADPLQSFISSMVAAIEEAEEFPVKFPQFTGISVIGSGARPLGCAAAEGAAAQAASAAAAAAAAVPPAQQAAGATTGPLRTATKAKKSAQKVFKVKKKKGSKAAKRKASKRLAKATKKLKKAKTAATAANQQLAQVSSTAGSTAGSASAAAAGKTAACG